ncbi:hypothetical protein NFI96_021842, partial [Prochilodus magdalenae]
ESHSGKMAGAGAALACGGTELSPSVRAVRPQGPGVPSLARPALTVLLLSSAVSGFVEDLDDKFKDTRMDDVWLVDFYAPWCGYCKKLEPIWYEVGAELKTSGSPVRVGKMDATAYSGMASEFGVRGYPTIKLLKGELAYNYKGPRTKDDIIEFANRVAGPSVRSLPSKQMFEHVQKRHDVLFVYIGGESPLKMYTGGLLHPQSPQFQQREPWTCCP